MLRRPKFISAPIQLFLLTTSHKPQIGKNNVSANGEVKLLPKRKSACLFTLYFIYTSLLLQSLDIDIVIGFQSDTSTSENSEISVPFDSALLCSSKSILQQNRVR